jgi:hypothetical protein
MLTDVHESHAELVDELNLQLRESHLHARVRHETISLGDRVQQRHETVHTLRNAMLDE